MSGKYVLTPKQLAALRALGERVVESSPAEVAVSALLLPHEAKAALAALENHRLVNSWVPVTGRTGEHLYVLNDEGQMICHALAQFKGTPPVGAVVRIPRMFETFRHAPSPYIEIAPEPQQSAIG